MKSARIEAIRQRRRDRALMAQLRAETMPWGPLVVTPQTITPFHMYAGLAMLGSLLTPRSKEVLQKEADRDGLTVPEVIARYSTDLAHTMLEAGK